MSKIKGNNSTIKILALFISIVLWSYVRGEINPRIVREFKNIEVAIINDSIINNAGLVILEPKEIKVNVKVSGRRNDINLLKREEILAEVNMINTGKGTYRLPIDIRLPFKVELEDISQRYVLFEIDSIETVQREITLKTTRNEIVTPRNVKVNGPSQLINKVENLTVDFNLSKLKPNEKVRLPIIALDSKGKEVKGIKLSPKTVEIFLPQIKKEKELIKEEDVEILEPKENTVKEEIKVFEIPINEVELLHLEAHLKATIQSDINKVKVTLKGNEDTLNKITVKDLKLILDLKGLGEGSHNLKLTFLDLENIQSQEINPNEITVNIEKVEQ